MQHVTTSTKITDIKREWHLIDVKGKTLGRVSTEIAKLLMGKAKPYFVRHLDCGDFVIVINAKDVATTGKPEEIISHAVKGMLPQNRLRDKMLGRLFVFAGSEHTYEDKLK